MQSVKDKTKKSSTRKEIKTKASVRDSGWEREKTLAPTSRKRYHLMTEVVKLPQYHFYEQKDRLLSLLNKENDHKYELAVRRQDAELTTEPLTERELREKEHLLATGFSSWTKTDFLTFVRGLEKYTRKGFKEISELLGTKTEKEVRDYAEVFWQRGTTELEDWERISRNVEKAEELRKELEENMRLLVGATQDSTHYDDITFEDKVYSKFKSRLYLEEHDKFLVFHAAKLGLDSWDRLKEAVRKESAFELDPYIRSRAEGDLHKRIGQVVKFLKAQEEFVAEKLKQAKKHAKAEERKKSEKIKTAPKAKPSSKQKASKKSALRPDRSTSKQLSKRKPQTASNKQRNKSLRRDCDSKLKAPAAASGSDKRNKLSSIPRTPHKK